MSAFEAISQQSQFTCCIPHFNDDIRCSVSMDCIGVACADDSHYLLLFRRETYIHITMNGAWRMRKGTARSLISGAFSFPSESKSHSWCNYECTLDKISANALRLYGTFLHAHRNSCFFSAAVDSSCCNGYTYPFCFCTCVMTNEGWERERGIELCAAGRKRLRSVRK